MDLRYGRHGVAGGRHDACLSIGEKCRHPYMGNEIPPPRTSAFLRNVGMLMQHIHTEPIGVYRAKVESEWVYVAL